MFEGYTQESVDFMWGIRFNNERGWFMDHKESYQKYFLEPTKELAGEVYDAMHKEMPDEPLMLKVSRIYRDARRLHGRGPYKDHLWFCIRTGDEDWTGRPTFFYEIAPEYISYGMGFWRAAPSVMEAYRKKIDANPEQLEKMVKQLDDQALFQLEGPSYARPKGVTTEVLTPWYQKKNITIEHTRPLDESIFSPRLSKTVSDGLVSLIPFYHYFEEVCASVPVEQQNHNEKG